MGKYLDKYAASVSAKTGWSIEEAKSRLMETRKRIKITYKDYVKERMWKVAPEKQGDYWEDIRQKRENKKVLVVVVTRNYSTGLSVIRSLGSAGFVVDAIGSSLKKGGSALLAESKYVRNHIEVLSRKLDGNENLVLLNVLRSYKDSPFEKMVLFPTDDYTTSIINNYADQLKDIFYFPRITDEKGMEYYMDKGVQCKIAELAGMRAPQTFQISLRETPIILPQGISYPCFCKPVSSYKGMKTEMKKCENEEELLTHLKLVQEKLADRDFLIQEYIDIEYEMAVEGYACDGKSIVPGVVKKERVANWETGVSVTGEFLDINEYQGLKEQVKQVMSKIPYNGLFDMDLMYSNGKIYFTELNFRSGGLTYVFVKNGVNLPALFVRDCTGLSHLERQVIPQTFNTHFLYEKMAWEDVIHGYMTVKELRALKRSVDFSIMDDKNDKGPYKKYLEEIKRRYENIKASILVTENFCGMDHSDVQRVWNVAHEAKWSWIKSQREMQYAYDLWGITYQDYLEQQLWQGQLCERIGDYMGFIKGDNGIDKIDFSNVSAKYFQDRMAKWSTYRQEEQDREDRFKQSIQDDLQFKCADFRQLTAAEKAAVTKFWKPYKFAVIPPLNACRVYTSSSGIFSPYYISNAMIKDVYAWSCPEAYRIPLQNKSYTAKYFTHAKTPKTIVRNVSGINMDYNWDEITLEQIVALCDTYMSTGKELVLKASSAAGGGTQVSFLSGLSQDEVRNLLCDKTDYILQEVIVQHEGMKAFNETSVNTLRVTTIHFENEIDLLAGLIRVGVTGSRLDNHVQGGTIVGVTPEGKTLDWALTGQNEKIRVLPSGLKLENGVKVPFYDEAVQLVKNCHKEIAMVKIVSWDVAITPDGPVIVECNFGGDLRLHQAVTGPVFGENTAKIMTTVYGRKFSKNRADFDYDYREFNKIAVISRYANDEEEVLVPATLNGKKIVRICAKAFYKKSNMKKVVIPEGVRWIDAEAFRACINLEEVVLPSTLIRINARAFKNCRKLAEINISPSVIVQKSAFEGCDLLEYS